MNILRNSRDEWTRLIEQYADSQKRYGEDDDLEIAEDMSDQLTLIRQLLKHAAERAKEKGLTVEDSETQEIFEDALRIGKSITYAYPAPREGFSKEKAERCFTMLSTAYPGSVLEDIKRDGEIGVDRDQHERGVVTYIRSDYRDAWIDRMLVRAVAEMELTAYIDSEVSPNVLTGQSRFEEARTVLWWQWLKNIGKFFVFAAIFCGFLIFIEVQAPEAPDLLFVIGVPLIAGAFLLFTAVTGVLLFLLGGRIKKPHRERLALLEAAASFYTEFHHVTTISVSHLLRRVEELRQKGVVWPQSLYVLLDDFDRRGLTML